MIFLSKKHTKHS